MGTIIVSFRVDYGDGKDYSKRWSAINAKIKSYGTEDQTWDGTTSFYLMSTASSAKSIATGVFALPEFSSARDEILAINLADKTDYQSYGAIKGKAKLEKLLSGR